MSLPVRFLLMRGILFYRQHLCNVFRRINLCRWLRVNRKTVKRKLPGGRNGLRVSTTCVTPVFGSRVLKDFIVLRIFLWRGDYLRLRILTKREDQIKSSPERWKDLSREKRETHWFRMSRKFQIQCCLRRQGTRNQRNRHFVYIKFMSGEPNDTLKFFNWVYIKSLSHTVWQ